MEKKKRNNNKKKKKMMKVKRNRKEMKITSMSQTLNTSENFVHLLYLCYSESCASSCRNEAQHLHKHWWKSP
jgi:hypothetical protein